MIQVVIEVGWQLQCDIAVAPQRKTSLTEAVTGFKCTHLIDSETATSQGHIKGSDANVLYTS